MTDFFSPEYFAARDRFRSGVLSTGGQIESISLEAKGPGDRDLTIDIGWFGSTQPKRALIHSSGLHGIEGFAGSAIQLQWLDQGPPILPPDGAVAMVHILNPFGMAWLRRANENNVDLNHNFLGSDEEFSGAPKGYSGLVSGNFFQLPALLRPSVLMRCMTEGQYEFPDGLFFGGRQHEQVTRRFQLYISGKLASAERIVAIDVHTGPTEPGGKGSLGGLYSRMFSGADLSFETQNFKTCHYLRALAALRKGDPSGLIEAFCPQSRKWRARVLSQGAEMIAKALADAFDSAPANGMTAH